MNTCIICDKENETKSIEHIVPESFGNDHYIMKKGEVCDECNNRFSKFEDKALSNSIFALERARLGIKTKKGKNVKGRIGELNITGDPNFRKEYITIKGLNEVNVQDLNPNTKEFSFLVDAFDKSEVAYIKILASHRN